MALPFPIITRIPNNNPKALASLWNDKYTEIDMNFGDLDARISGALKAPSSTLITIGDDDTIVVIDENGIVYGINRQDLIKALHLQNYTTSFHNYGAIGSGVFTPNHDTNLCTYHIATATGNITIDTPVVSLPAGYIGEGVIELIDGNAHTIIWGADWDFGAAGEPVLTSKSLIAYARGSGDVKTKAWHEGGFS